MKRHFLSAFLLTLSTAVSFAQQAAPPAPAPADPDTEPTTPTAPVPPPKDPGQPSIQNLEFGSFEMPPVKGRFAKADGGNILMFAKSEWARFEAPDDKEGGRMTVGLTNEVARTGRQSIFVDFDHLTRRQATAQLSSVLLPVFPGLPYHVSIWGQVDAKKPLLMTARLPQLRLQLDYFKEDLEEQVDQSFIVQPMPGSRNQRAFFVPNRWSEYYQDITVPADAAWIKITWAFVAPAEPGEINGAMFFDDATLIGQKRNPVPELEELDEPAAPAAAGAPGAMVEPTPGRAAPVEPAATPAPVKATPTPPAKRKK